MIITNLELNKEAAILLACIEQDNKQKDVENYAKDFSNEIDINDELHRIADIRY